MMGGRLESEITDLVRWSKNLAMMDFPFFPAAVICAFKVFIVSVWADVFSTLLIGFAGSDKF